MIWLVLGVLAVRLFQFTPGQFALGLRVASVDQRLLVGLGRATARGVLIAFVIPALFVDVDGRGIQDRVTGTAVVRAVGALPPADGPLDAAHLGVAR